MGSLQHWPAPGCWGSPPLQPLEENPQGSLPEAELLPLPANDGRCCVGTFKQCTLVQSCLLDQRRDSMVTSMHGSYRNF